MTHHLHCNFIILFYAFIFCFVDISPLLSGQSLERAKLVGVISQWFPSSQPPAPKWTRILALPERWIFKFREAQQKAAG